MTGTSTLAISRCTSCHARFLPRPGPCPKCGSMALGSAELPALGTVVAATELLVPAPGWPAPHRLALVEAEEGVRLLAIVKGELPNPGEVVSVATEGALYFVARAPPPESSR